MTVHVLIVKTSSLGDVIHTLPALTDALRAIPGIRFDWAVEESFAEIPGWHPAVDRVIPVAIRRWRRTLWQRDSREQWRECKRALRHRSYDTVIDAQGLLKSAFLARQVPAPRCGPDRHSAREGLAALCYHKRIAVPREMHAVERTRLLFARALDYPSPKEQGDYGVRASLQGTAAELPGGLLFFHSTARAEKLWPEASWVELADTAGAAGYRVWLPWGSEAERQRAQRIATQAENAEVLPRLSLEELASMLLGATGAIALDTGLGHLSAALDVPTVSLYGPTRIDLVGAYGASQAHIQSPVGPDDTGDPAAMMASITPQQVWQSLRQVLPGSAGR